MSCGFCREGGPYARFGDLRMRIGRAGSEPRLVVEHRGPQGAAKALMPVAYCPVCGAALSKPTNKEAISSELATCGELYSAPERKRAI